MKKTRDFQSILLANGVLKTMLLMKLSFVIILIASLQVSANIYSQNKITVDFRNERLDRALKEVEQKSDYRFVYSSLRIPREIRITFRGFDLPVKEVLDALLANTGLSYQLMENNLAVITRSPQEIPPPRTITGTVTNEKGEPLAGVTVYVKGTDRYATTIADGTFSIQVDDKDKTLVFSYVSMGDTEIVIGSSNTLQVQLSPSQSQLSDVVVIGYGSQRRRDMTGSIVSIDAKKFAERPVVNALEAMAGQAAGLQIAQGNAAPGQLSSVIIRGISSISAGYEPLFVVDGFPTTQANANAINPSDIQSVEVLKDASATAIYGSRGANGVILITTKSARGGKPTFVLDMISGIANVNKKDLYPVLNAAEYVQYAKEIVANNGGTLPGPVADWDGVTNTDWQSLIYRTAPYQNFSLAATGGNEMASYSLSMGYIDQDGIIKNTGYKKYSLRAKVDFKPVRKVRIGLNIAPNFTRSKNMPDGDFNSPQGAATFMPPIIPVRMPDGSYGETQKFPGVAAIQLANPLSIIELYKDRTNSTFVLANADLEWEIMEGLRFRTSVGANWSGILNETYTPSTLGPLPRNPTGTYRNNTILNWLNENTLNYNKAFGNHSFNILGGFTYQHESITSAYILANSFPTNSVETLNGGAVQPGGSGTTKSEWAIVSSLARLNYSFKSKYLITATIRRDGSSRFGQNKKYGVFPSAAIGWNVSEEPFMKSISAIGALKLRGSYGRTGNNLIGDFASIGLLSTVNQPFGLGTGNNNIGLSISTPANPDLTWEIADQVDVGMDLSMFRNRFTFTFDYYNRISKGLLLAVNVAATSGYTSVLQNIGKMRSRGYEFTANVQVLDAAVKWNVGGNLSLIGDQEVLALGPDGSPLIGFFGTLVTAVGGKLEAGRYLHSIGIVTQKDIDAGYPLFGGAAAKPGDYKYEDLNGDGIIDNFNQKDGKILGDNINRGIYGINSSVSFKNLDLNILIQGQWGARVYDLINQLGQLGAIGINSLKKFYDGRYISETEPGNGITPRAGFFGAGTPNTEFLNPTAYLRLRNVNLGYTFSPSVVQRWRLSSIRAFISIDNLARITNFMGGNPGATRFTSANGAEVRLVGNGRALGNNSAPSLPYPRTFSFGVSVRF
jgi:TonB-dependent starch-binding outer membrane protein SusC